VSNQGGVGAVDARLSTDGQSLYVDESKADSIGIFSVDGGQLTEQATVSLPAGATPAGVAVR
jgi:6-phosphogluconolactonase (cycloisomerase 2 family)